MAMRRNRKKKREGGCKNNARCRCLKTRFAPEGICVGLPVVVLAPPVLFQKRHLKEAVA